MSCSPIRLSTRSPSANLAALRSKACLRSQITLFRRLSLDGRLTGISLPPKTPRPCEAALENVKNAMDQAGTSQVTLTPSDDADPPCSLPRASSCPSASRFLYTPVRCFV